MPELPDLTVYLECLAEKLRGETLREFELRSSFVLRTVEPKPDQFVGRQMRAINRIGKRIVIEFERDLFCVIHLMIAGRLKWRQRDQKPPGGKNAIASFGLATGRLWLTEASSKKRASIHLVAGRESLREFGRGGLEVLDADLDAFTAAITRDNRTLKRALTDPRYLSGIGNAYSDEILFHARLSPVVLTGRLDQDALQRLYDATGATIHDWTDRLRTRVRDGFPEKVTAFHDDMAVHGRFRKPCRVCESPIQRIRYASNECNYCAVCQNAGRLLADRGLSQLMRKDWPRTLEDLEELRGSC